MASYINVDDDEQAASAIVEGLQRMLRAEREAHGAVKESSARMKRQLEKEKKQVAELQKHVQSVAACASTPPGCPTAWGVGCALTGSW